MGRTECQTPYLSFRTIPMTQVFLQKGKLRLNEMNVAKWVAESELKPQFMLLQSPFFPHHPLHFHEVPYQPLSRENEDCERKGHWKAKPKVTGAITRMTRTLMADITDLNSFRQTASVSPLCLSKGSQWLICGGLISHMAPMNPGKGQWRASWVKGRVASPPGAGVSSGNLTISRELGSLSLFSAMGAQVG